jgi:hypothetical protein
MQKVLETEKILNNFIAGQKKTLKPLFSLNFFFLFSISVFLFQYGLFSVKGGEKFFITQH